LILELWDLAKRFASIGLGIQNAGEYLNTYLKNDEGFYTYGVVMFAIKVSKMMKQMRKK
jgi:hypothetical protein